MNKHTFDAREHRLIFRETPDVPNENRPETTIHQTTHKALENMQEGMQKQILEKVMKDAQERLTKVGGAASPERQKIIADVMSAPGLDDAGFNELVADLIERRLVSTNDFLPLMSSTIGLYSRRAALAMAVVVADNIEAASMNLNTPYLPTLNTYTNALMNMMQMRLINREMLDARLAILQNETILGIIGEGLEDEEEPYSAYMKALQQAAKRLMNAEPGTLETEEQMQWREQLQKAVAAMPKRMDAWMKTRQETRKKNYREE